MIAFVISDNTQIFRLPIRLQLCVDNEKVIVEYNFLTHQKNKERINDNWISRYKDLDDLENRIKNIRLV